MLSKKNKKAIVILSIILICSMGLYLYLRIFQKAFDNNLSLTPKAFQTISFRSLKSLLAMFISGVLIALSSLAFQTLTENRVLTPSIIGFDSIFIAVQAVLVFFSSKVTFFQSLIDNEIYNFILTALLMMLLSLLLYKTVLRKDKNNIVILMLFGLVLTGVVRSFTNYIEVLLNPQEFQQLKAITVVSITNINTKILFAIIPLVGVIIYYFIRERRTYDVMLLGESKAKSLGVDYQKTQNQTLVFIALALAITTALVGPLTFLGLLAVNISRELFKNYRHQILFLGSSLISVTFLIGGQALVELLHYTVPVIIIIDLIGGIYMIYLILEVNIK